MLLAAGEGNRLRPITNNIPKCMIPIAGIPILAHNIEWLAKFALTDIVINLYSFPQMVMDYLGDGHKWGVHITYSIEAKILGTSGGVKNAAWFFNDEPFLVWYGDNLSTCDIKNLVDFHDTKKGFATIALFNRDDVGQSGILELDENDRVLRFKEKPALDEIFSKWVNAGIYVLEPEALGSIPEGVSDFGRDVFPSWLTQNKKIFGYKMQKDEKLWWIDTPEDLVRTQTAINWSVV